MLEACVRNIWQAREIKQGRPAFHVGPTVYRGLWVVDGSFLLEAAAILGRGRDARAAWNTCSAIRSPMVASKSCRISGKRMASSSGRRPGTRC